MRNFLAALVAAFFSLASINALAQLTPGFNIPQGNDIGTFSAAQPPSTNLVACSYQITTSCVSAWTATSTTLAAQTSYAWNNSFTPVSLTTTAGASGVVLSPSATVSAATVYSVSAEFSVDPAFTFSGTNQSGTVRLAVRWSGGVAREDYVTFNTGAGTISGSSGVSNAYITPLTVTTIGGTQVKVVRVGFATTATPAATSAGKIAIYPAISGASGTSYRVYAGAPQIERFNFPTAFIATPDTATRPRPAGTLPRNLTSPINAPVVLTDNYTYNPQTDNATVFEMTTASKTFYLDNIDQSGTIPGANGQTVTIVNKNTGTMTITGVTAGTLFFGPGLPAVGGASITLPPTGNGSSYPNAAVTLTYDSNYSGWLVTQNNWSTTISTGGGGGGGLPPVGNTGSIIWSNGVAWVASTALYPNSVGNNQILFGNPADTITSSADLTWDGSTLNVGGDVTITGDFTANEFDGTFFVLTNNANTNASYLASNSTNGAAAVSGLSTLSSASTGFIGTTAAAYAGIAGTADSLLLTANNASNGITFALDGVWQGAFLGSGIFRASSESQVGGSAYGIVRIYDNANTNKITIGTDSSGGLMTTDSSFRWPSLVINTTSGTMVCSNAGSGAVGACSSGSTVTAPSMSLTGDLALSDGGKVKWGAGTTYISGSSAGNTITLTGNTTGTGTITANSTVTGTALTATGAVALKTIARATTEDAQLASYASNGSTLHGLFNFTSNSLEWYDATPTRRFRVRNTETTFSPSGVSSALIIAKTASGAYGLFTFNGDTGLNTTLGMFGGDSGDPSTLYLQAPTGGGVSQRINGTVITSATGTGLSIAGNLTASSLTTTGSAGGKKVVCVDTATGTLYASSTGTDCSN